MDTTQCANCKIKLSPGGRPNKVTELRFCMARDCQAVRQRQYRAIRRQEQYRDEDRPCFYCGIELPTRPGRVTDSPVGRWCPNRACQRDRTQRLALFGMVERGEITDQLVIDLANGLYDMVAKRGRTECAGCGRRDAIVNYRHPRRDDPSRDCLELGDYPVSPDVMPHAFPDDE